MLSAKMKLDDQDNLNRIILYLDGDNLTIQKAAPTNESEATELHELKKQGLMKFLVIDTSMGFVADELAIQKLIDDLSESGQIFSEIVDRSSEGHNLVQIHASDIRIRKQALTPEQFKQLVQEEDLILKNYKEPTLKKKNALNLFF